MAQSAKIRDSRPRDANVRAAERGTRRHSGEAGFAYLMALFMVIAVIIASTVVLQNWALQGKRIRERETIWRGNQYVRAIRLYYHKTGKYPQSLDDLEKGMPELHFLRKEYKDPMNKEDGKWRLIYVNAAGQIIGSVRFASLQQMALLDGAIQGTPALPGQPAGQPGAASDLSSSDFAGAGAALAPPLPKSGPYAPAGSSDDTSEQPQPEQEQPAPSSDQPAQNTQTGQTASAPGISMLAGQAGGQLGNVGGQNPVLAANAAILQQKPTGAVDGPVIGAFLTGVGSRVDEPSVMWLSGGKAKKYKDWEFIWNPLEDQARAMQQGLNGGNQPGVGVLGQPGQSPGGFPMANPGGGTPSGPGGSPTPQPPAPSQQPQ